MKMFDNILKKKKKDKLEYPWQKYYDEDKRNVSVDNISFYEYFERCCYSHKYDIATNYFGEEMTYKELLDKIDLCARSLECYGVRENDVVTILMPNTPEAVIAFYAVNKIGAISNMVHPLSSEEELKNSLITTKSVMLIAVNIAYDTIDKIIDETKVYKTVLVSPKDSMPKVMSLLYTITKDLKNKIPKSNERYLYWKDFMERGKSYKKSIYVSRCMNDDAIYLHSGGTTGTPKNIVLTNLNVNSLMEQAVIVFPKIGVGENFLAVLPMFHCFGLLVSLAAPLCMGSKVSLVPTFDAKRFDKLIRKYNPTVITGVPTLFEALASSPHSINLDLSNLKYVVSGGDSLTPERNKKFNDFLKEHNCSEHIIQGYGLTETSGPCCVGALGSDKLGSVGIPLPGMVIKIMDQETMEELPALEIGEICISGPNVMSRYLDNQEETDAMIKTDENGVRWVKTGDLGYLDEDGVLFFVQRLKRMIITSGYNVYPSHIENIISKHKDVELCGVIGIPHPYKVQVAKAFIVLKKDVDKDKAEKEILELCQKNLARYMIPKKIEFRDSLPKTMVGKINYRMLEKEESDKN